MNASRANPAGPPRNTGSLQVVASGEREIVMTRVFNAPRRLVFDAWTKPELVKRWLGVFGDYTMAVCEIDLRVGGAYRYVWDLGRGKPMGMGGVYLEIVPPERIVCTEVFDEPWYAGDAVDTLTLIERDGRTTLTVTVQYVSREVRDNVLKSDMQHGLAAGYDGLARMLKALQAGKS